MSTILLKKIVFSGSGIRDVKEFMNLPSSTKIFTAKYSRRRDSKSNDRIFKVVKSNLRVKDSENCLGGECRPNWEILEPWGNRFYLPNAIGPAWQSANSTLVLEAPLESLVDFEGNATEPNEATRLHFSINECPSLIKKCLYELFPTPEVISNEKLILMILRFYGDPELGARKFVLAAREIIARLRLHGYWADFMNPFSGKPFHSWYSGKNLYKVDDRFRGLNMKLLMQNQCMIITSEDTEKSFAGAIYSNAPSNYLQLRSLIDTKL